MKKVRLRSGYTTGACAAAAAKAAIQLLTGERGALPSRTIDKVDIPFPDGSRVTFAIHESGYRVDDLASFASVIKDAGDDPDVTNGAEIVVEAKMMHSPMSHTQPEVLINGGRGVGIVTKPGLAIPVGEPAINPVPRKMIADAVSESLSNISLRSSDLSIFQPAGLAVEVTISVTDGELLAKKTLNERLGIIGGLSILGTTGIVRPLSSDAWTATIASSLDVAKAMGRNEIVLSAGRASEKAHIKRYGLPEESYVMMGDYLEFSLREASQRGFSRIYLCAQWAKMLKIAMATPQTHVRHGAIDMAKTIVFLAELGVKITANADFNTAREIFDHLLLKPAAAEQAQKRVCNAAKSYAAHIADPTHISTCLVNYDGEIIASSV